MINSQETFRETLKNKGAHFTDKGRISHFQDIEDSYQTFQNSAVLVPMLGTSIYKLTGADRLEFLHGQVSNTVKGLKVGQHNTSLMLNIKGHALAQLQIYIHEDFLIIAVEGGMGPFVKAHLERHIIFDQVEIEDLSNEWVAVTLIGKEASQEIGKLFMDLANVIDNDSFQPSHEAMFAKTKRTSYIGFDLVTPIDKMPEVLKAFELAGEDLLTLARIEAGIAHAEFEGGEGSLPQEVGLEPHIHYKKGCYLGQEIMARIEARGNLRKDIFTLQLSAMPSDFTLTSQGKKVGKITSIAKHPEIGIIALGSLRKDYVAPLQVADEGIKVEARARHSLNLRIN